MTCPSCNGTTEGGMAFVHRTTGCNLERVKCSTCRGTGSVHDDYPAWKAAGDKLRQDRLSRGLSLREEAQRRGIKASVLSDMEFGRITTESR